MASENFRFLISPGLSAGSVKVDVDVRDLRQPHSCEDTAPHLERSAREFLPWLECSPPHCTYSQLQAKGESEHIGVIFTATRSIRTSA